MAAARAAAARGERKSHGDRIRPRLIAAARLRVNETVMEKRTRRTLYKEAAVEDLRVFLEAANERAGLPTPCTH